MPYRFCSPPCGDEPCCRMFKQQPVLLPISTQCVQAGTGANLDLSRHQPRLCPQGRRHLREIRSAPPVKNAVNFRRD